MAKVLNGKSGPRNLPTIKILFFFYRKWLQYDDLEHSSRTKSAPIEWNIRPWGLFWVGNKPLGGATFSQMRNRRIKTRMSRFLVICCSLIWMESFSTFHFFIAFYRSKKTVGYLRWIMKNVCNLFLAWYNFKTFYWLRSCALWLRLKEQQLWITRVLLCLFPKNSLFKSYSSNVNFMY